jgi:hypothetical protein
MPLVAYGLIYTLWLCVPGAVLILTAIYAWAFEPVDDPDSDHGSHGDGGYGSKSADPDAGEATVD